MFLIESALLTHGLCSLSNDKIASLWKIRDKNIAWVEKGKIIIGDIDEFLIFRKQRDNLIRIDCNTLNYALQNGVSGALTASGTMSVCQMKNIKLAVTCGMGGIGDIKGEELCPDLPALQKIPVSLISTSPKDMLYIDDTLLWLKEHEVETVCLGSDVLTGYIFNSCNIAVKKGDLKLLVTGSKQLILNPIPQEKRIGNLEILNKSIEKGKQAERENKYYHPAVNAEIDRLTNGYSSMLQLQSLIANAEIAYKLIGNRN